MALYESIWLYMAQYGPIYGPPGTSLGTLSLPPWVPSLVPLLGTLEASLTAPCYSVGRVSWRPSYGLQDGHLAM